MSTRKPPRQERNRYAHRLQRLRDPRMGGPQQAPGSQPEPRRNAWIDCGWGRLLFAHTFDDAASLAEAMRNEAPNCRDIAYYVPEPHVALAAAPLELENRGQALLTRTQDMSEALAAFKEKRKPDFRKYAK